MRCTTRVPCADPSCASAPPPQVGLWPPACSALYLSDTVVLMLAATSSLAGNLTLLCSVANLIVAELAGRCGVHVAFRAHVCVGVPITLLTLLAALLLV